MLTLSMNYILLSTMRNIWSLTLNAFIQVLITSDSIYCAHICSVTYGYTLLFWKILTWIHLNMVIDQLRTATLSQSCQLSCQFPATFLSHATAKNAAKPMSAMSPNIRKMHFWGTSDCCMDIICLHTPTKSSLAVILRVQPNFYEHWFMRYGFCDAFAPPGLLPGYFRLTDHDPEYGTCFF